MFFFVTNKFDLIWFECQRGL